MALLIAACSYPQATADQGAMLVSSGFVQRAADTPRRQAGLAQLPRYTLVRRRWNGKEIYVYAGNPACNCAYLGNEAAFFRYKNNFVNAERQGTAASFGQARRGIEQQRSFAVREDSGFDPEAWGVDGWRD